jgi:plastocyanin
MRKLLLLPLLALSLVLGAASAGAAERTATIAPTGFPPLITIDNGDTVTWKNGDTVNRQIVADDNSFTSPVLQPGESWSHIFPEGGTYHYHGAFKPDQKGTVEVAATRVVLMRQSAQTVQIFRTVRLQGSVSAGASNGEVVRIEAKPRGKSAFSEVARTATKNGVWTVQVAPRRTTVYRAVWQNVPSSEHTVNVRPFLRLKQVGRHLVYVHVRADTTLVGRSVLLQRFNKRTHRWHTFRSVKLTRFTANRAAYDSTGRFRMSFPHGVILRAFMTKAQAGPLMYGPASSRALRV